MVADRIPSSVRFREQLLYKITFVAKWNCRSLNAQMEFLAQRCVEEFEREHGPIPLDEQQLGTK